MSGAVKEAACDLVGPKSPMENSKQPYFKGIDAGTPLGMEQLTEGQQRRVALFRSLENGICSRVEDMCATSTLEVSDVGVLVVSKEAYPLLFDTEESPGASVVLGHRERLYEFLQTSLPSSSATALDPYVDLLEPAPARCVRVLIIDGESLTILSYGTFITVRIGDGELPQA